MSAAGEEEQRLVGPPQEQGLRPLHLGLVFVCLAVVGLFNKLSQKWMTIPFYNYPLFVILFSDVVYIVWSFAYIFLVINWGNSIEEEQRNLPKWKFAIMGLLDSVSGILQVLAINYIYSGSVIILLQQSAIPISMLMSFFFLHARYKASHYVGALFVVIGLLVALLPSLLFPDDVAGYGRSQLLWCVVMIFSCVPMALSSVLKEKVFGEIEIDPIYLNGWVYIFQLLASLPLLPLSAIVQGFPVDELPTNLYDGLLCYGSVDSIHEDTYGPIGPLKTLGIIIPRDQCDFYGPLYLSVFLCCNICFNVLVILILKHGGANTLWLAMTVVVPLGHIAFALDFVPNHHNLYTTDVVGLVIIMLGLLLYRFFSIFWERYGEHFHVPGITDFSDNEEEIEDVVSSRSSSWSMPRVSRSFAESLGPFVESLHQTRRRERTQSQIRAAYLTRLGIANAVTGT